MELTPIGNVELNNSQQQPVVADPVSSTALRQVPSEVPQSQSQPVPNFFTPVVTAAEPPKGIEKATEKANEVVSEVFGQAVVHTIATDDEIKKQLLDTAKQVVEDKASTIADNAERESKIQHFMKHEDACSIFGYDEKTTSKFHVKVMSVWVFVLNTIYIFTIGGLIVAPVSFIMRKLKVVIKKTWLALLLALLIYLFIVVVIPLISTLIAKVTGNNASASQAVQSLASMF